MKRAFVTGHSGFSGTHLMAVLRESGYAVAGFDRSDGGDIRDRRALSRVIGISKPDVVFHLAAALKSSAPEELYAINVLGTVSLLEALSQLHSRPVVVIVSSSAVYGRSGRGRPVDERAPLRPTTHYGTSKLAQEQVAMHYARNARMRIVRARTFNLLGPGLPTTLACGSFVDAIARLERTAGGTLRTGDLRASRDFTDIRDACRAYVALAARGRAGSVYNVCSGRGVSLRRCLDVLLEQSRAAITAEVDPERVQEGDIDTQVGAAERLRAATGWEPTIPVEQSLADMLASRRLAVLP